MEQSRLLSRTREKGVSPESEASSSLDGLTSSSSSHESTFTRPPATAQKLYEARWKAAVQALVRSGCFGETAPSKDVSFMYVFTTQYDSIHGISHERVDPIVSDMILRCFRNRSKD